MKKNYKINKGKKVGDFCVCPSCNTEFIKEHYQQTFCKTKGGTICKDRYWNTVTPTKRNNTSRISPASREFTERRERRELFYDDHPFSSDALGQW
jgi:hypothetical protein